VNKEVSNFIASVEKETERIWLKEPEDIYSLKKGYLPSGAGIYNQYYSVLVMVSGEIRALGIHIFSDLLAFSRKSEFNLFHLKVMAKCMLKIDIGVISYFGLTLYGRYLDQYYNLIEKLKSKREFMEATRVMFTYTNRYQMWLHQIFPWGVSTFFKQQTPEKYNDVADRLEHYKNISN